MIAPSTCWPSASLGKRSAGCNGCCTWGCRSAVASVLCALICLRLFKPSVPFKLDKEAIAKQLSELGKLSKVEKRVIFWVGLAIVLWMTDSVHGIALGWVTAAIAVAMAMPSIGDVLKPAQWKQVPIETLLFLTAAIAIGKVGLSPA